jgi:cobalt-zinc-cadmium efflux system protein
LELAQRGLSVAILITATVMAVEAVGGILSNSLALLSDAGHMFTHFIALGLALLAVRMARRPATRTKTYGYYRAEILVALANGIILVFLALYIFYEAHLRFLQPPEVRGPMMLGVAIVGLGANLVVLLALKRTGSESINIRSAFMHVLSDTLSSVGVIIAGLIIIFTGTYVADPLVSVLIGAMILIWAIGLIREAGSILLEAVPKHIDVREITSEVKKVKGVRDLHDLHVWTITSGMHAMSGHLLIEDQMVSKAAEILNEVNELLRLKFGIAHTTLQLECEKCEGPFVCRLESRE